MVACALAAIAELKFGICHIGAAAYGTFMTKALRLLLILLLTLLIAHGVVEVRGLLALVALKLEKARKLRPEEDDEVEKRHDRQNGIIADACGNVAENVEEEVEYIEIGEPLHANRNDEHEEYLRIGIEQGKGHEHGKVDIICTVDRNAVPCDEADDACADDGKQHAAEVIGGELGRTPLPLKRRADPVVEVAGDEKIEGTCALGDQNEGDKTPDLPMEESIKCKGEETQEIAGGKTGQQSEHHVADDHIKHQVRNAEIRVQDTEAVDRLVELFQCGIPHLS